MWARCDQQTSRGQSSTRTRRTLLEQQDVQVPSLTAAVRMFRMPSQPGPKAQIHMHLEAQPFKLSARSMSFPAGTPGQLLVKLHGALNSLVPCKS